MLTEIKAVAATGTQLAVVIGGGNIFRGVQAETFGLDRVQGDYMGMLATVINSMALQSALEKLEVSTRLLSGLTIQRVCEPYIRRRARAAPGERPRGDFWGWHRLALLHNRLGGVVASHRN